MNKHILFVMKWLNNPESVSQEELYANKESVSYAVSYADWAAYSAAAYAYWAADWSAYSADAAAAAYWVDEYFKITGEYKQTYIDALGE
jgi:hypothetical protein